MKAILAGLAFLALNAHAQTVVTPDPAVPVSLQVQRLAPQLIAFAGSQANFESLVNGLAFGVPVTLTTVGAGGVTQTATFVPSSAAVSSPSEIARVLEATRQQLIASGVATPTAQQLGSLIAGATVPVTVGVVPPAATPGAAAAGGTLPSRAEQIQSRDAPVAPRISTSDTRDLGNTSDSPVPAAPAALGPGPVSPGIDPAPVLASPDGASIAAPPSATPAPPVQSPGVTRGAGDAPRLLR